jgi:hypothetical protein
MTKHGDAAEKCFREERKTMNDHRKVSWAYVSLLVCTKVYVLPRQIRLRDDLHAVSNIYSAVNLNINVCAKGVLLLSRLVTYHLIKIMIFELFADVNI